MVQNPYRSLSLCQYKWEMGGFSLKECVGLFTLISINISSLITRPWLPILSQWYVLFVAGFKQRLQTKKGVRQSASAAI
jgi:hypothetical protein